MTYNIKLISPWRFVLTAITPPILWAFATEPSGVPSIGFFVGLISIFTGFLVLPRYTAIAVIQIVCNSEGLTIKWQKQFFLQNKPDYFISWNDIKEYKHQSNLRYELFKLLLRDGSQIKFKVDGMFKNDEEFPGFLDVFKEKIEELNAAAEPSDHIEKAKSIYETTLGLTLAIVYAVAMIAIPVLLYVFPPSKSANYGPLIIGYVGLLFYISKVIEYRKANKKKATANTALMK